MAEPTMTTVAGITDYRVAEAPERKEAAFVPGFVEEPKDKDKLIVAVIPAYNEDRFIGSVILKVRRYVDWVIVIDDGSRDKTTEVAREAGADVITLSPNAGKAKALEAGFARALDLGADVVVALDADGQHNPDEIPDVILPILEGAADMVIGSRFRDAKSDIPLWRQFGQHALTLATNVASGVASSDSQSGFRAFSGDVLATLRISGRGFAVESEMQFWARENGLRVQEASITCVYEEKPKRNPIVQGWQVLNGILSMVSQSRPLLFFGVSGMLIVSLGIAFWYRIVQIYNLTSELALGHALLATLFITLGVLSTFEGITLHVLRRIIRQQETGGPQALGRNGQIETGGDTGARAGIRNR